LCCKGHILIYLCELYHWRQARLYSLKKGLLATNSPAQPACTDGAKGLDWLANGKIAAGEALLFYSTAIVAAKNL
jgi:hypothetical protein